MEVNQCDVWCPYKAALSAEYKVGTAEALETGESGVQSLIGRVRRVGKAGVSGVVQMAEAARCPSSNKPVEEWSPQQKCVDGATKLVESIGLTKGDARIGDHERKILDPLVTEGEDK